MASVGAVLRTEREAQGRAVEEIAAELCLMPSYLRAIEADQVAQLPGVFFYKSFVRQYAALLGVNLAKLQPEIQVLTALAEPEPVVEEKPIRVPDPIVEAANRIDLNLSGRSWAAPVAALMLAILGGAGFFAWWKSAAEEAAPQPAAQIREVSVHAGAPTVNVTTTTGADGVRRLELNLSATEETWLSISSDGEQIFAGTLFPDQTKTVSGLATARLKVGNAGGLNVQWNGREIGPLGESGQVRVVVFTPEGFRILQREEEAPRAGQSAL